jgi:HlyD family secretion protein
MKSLNKILQFVLKRKIISAIILIVLIIAAYFIIKAFSGNAAPTRYVLAAVAKGTIITSVSGSGQVSVTDSLDVKSKASGDVLKVSVKNGDEVKAGAVLAQLDTKEAYKSLRDAQLNLESAQLSLQKLQQPADSLSILQAENAITAALDSKQNAQNSLNKAYEDGFNTVSDTFLDLPAIMTGLNDILYGYTFSAGQANVDYYTDRIKIYDFVKALNFKDAAQTSYQAARTAYDANFDAYKAENRLSAVDRIAALIDETYNTSRDIAEAIKNINNLVQLYKDELTARNLNPETVANTHLASLNSYTGTANSQLLALLSIKQTIQTSEQTILSSERTIEEKQLSLENLKAGTDALDLKAQELTLRQREYALTDAQDNLVNYTVRAPFDGVIASIDLRKGDSLSSGTVAATLITKQKIAEISLNEVDVAKVKVGQKVTLTFDAISDLTISGEVAQIDILGTVSQGVVNYNVKIIFDTQDERVKPGMSVSAAIVTDIKQDVLTVPNAAIKTSGETNYVEMPDEIVDSQAISNTSGVTLSKALKQQAIIIGLANDSVTEVTEGLSEGDVVVSRIINSSTKTSTSTSSGSSLFQMGGPGR